MRFIGREPELETLERLYNRNRSGFLVLYGRRRIGKTSLLSQWLKQGAKPRVLFWTATTEGSAYLLREFSQALVQFDPKLGAALDQEFTFRDWPAALNYYADIAKNSEVPVVLIIDEFTHLVASHPSIVSTIQIEWDHRLSQIPNVRLVLTGSLIGMIEQDVLSIRAPLYGRALYILKLRPLHFGHLAELFPKWAPAERVAVYAICGGIPAYLDVFVQAGTFEAGLRSGLAPGSLMLTDPALLLHDQLKDPYIYESVLASLGSGFHVWNDIAKMAGISEGSLGFYLKGLEALDLVEERDPILSSPMGRKSRYFVKDPFLRFYYRFIQRFRTNIERNDLTPVIKAINAELRAFIGTYIFEELCREWVFAPGVQERLGFTVEKIGAYWSQNRGQGVQLDVVAANVHEKKLFVGEAKWGTDVVSRNILTDLIKRSRRMPQVEAGWDVQYGLFAREDFTEATKQAARELGVRLIPLKQLEADLVRAAKYRPMDTDLQIEF
ncbi:MAG TPA: ATP-binding protein [Anaerolineae bacterium]|nr:ATP-binding protein [Anaerolineae bacterium]